MALYMLPNSDDPLMQSFNQETLRSIAAQDFRYEPDKDAAFYIQKCKDLHDIKMALKTMHSRIDKVLTFVSTYKNTEYANIPAEEIQQFKECTSTYQLHLKYPANLIFWPADADPFDAIQDRIRNGLSISSEPWDLGWIDDFLHHLRIAWHSNGVFLAKGMRRDLEEKFRHPIPGEWGKRSATLLPKCHRSAPFLYSEAGLGAKDPNPFKNGLTRSGTMRRNVGNSLDELESCIPFLKLYGYLNRPLSARAAYIRKQRNIPKLSLPERLQKLRESYESGIYLSETCINISKLRNELLSQQKFALEIMTGLRNNTTQKGVYINAPTLRGQVDTSLLPTLEMLTAYDDALLLEIGIRPMKNETITY